MLLLLEGFQLLFDNLTANSIKRSVTAGVGKAYKICAKKLNKLGAPWLTDYPVDVNTSLTVGLFCTYLF